jgi:TraX protein
MQHAATSTGTPQVVDATDWLKTVAIIATAVGHIGYFFIDNETWWSVFGRLAAPILFFFLGYGQTRAVPLY